MANSKKKFNLIPESNLRQLLLLMIFGIIMLFIRIIPIYHKIFTDWPGQWGNFVNFAADDAVYHMRLVHNTLHHLPWRIFFDPFTHFPFGNQIHFGPLFTLIIAATALIAGAGNPTPELTNLVAAYIPPIMGALCLIPVYFIARNLSSKTAAIISCFILVFLPGEFLQRSALGFVDHHIAEVLFAASTCAFLIAALARTKKSNLSLPATNDAIFAGIFLGLFILVWPAALMFGAIFLLFFITQLLIEHFKHHHAHYLLSLAAPIYLIPIAMVLPYALMNPHLELTYYSLTQPIILITMLALLVFSYLIHLGCKRHQLPRYLYYLLLALVLMLTTFILHRYTAKLTILIQDGYKLLFAPTPGMRTVSEVRPAIMTHDGKMFTIAILWYSYFWTLPMALTGLGYLAYRTYKNSHPAELFLLIWSMVIIFAACAQCRFNYYLAINVAILAGCYGFYPLLVLLTHLKTTKILLYPLFSILVILIVDPILMLLMDKNIPSGVQITKEQYHSFLWLKEHTPDPQGKIVNKNFDYTAGYYPIPKDPSLPYQYPKSAYGIMSWWDIGHQLTYIAERIPNANPFQLGIVEKNSSIGAAPFFISTDEKSAVKILDQVGSKYVLIDQKTATNIEGIGIWCHDTKNWTTPTKINIQLPSKKTGLKALKDSTRFLQSMINRLFYEDTNNLQHFRLVYESEGDYLVMIRRVIFKPDPQSSSAVLNFKNYHSAQNTANDVNKIFWTNQDKTVLAYQARPPTKKIKIFEKVTGATISGKVPKELADNSKVNLTLKLKTKYNRIFTYRQTTRINEGKFELVVPYPTTKMSGDGYSYDITPIGEYQLQIGAKIIKVTIPEDAVMRGGKITVF